MVFVRKIELFTMRVFQANQGRKKIVFLIFWIEANKFQTRKVKFQKGPKNRIFHGGQSIVFVKKLSFLPCRFLGKPRQKRSFFNILERKEYFLDEKSKASKTSEKSDFSKGLVHSFRQKFELFTMRVFRQTQTEKIVF